MKILQLANKFPYPPKDGGSIATLSFSKALSDLGHQVTVMAMNTSKHYTELKLIPESLKEKIEFIGVPVNTDIKPLRLIGNYLFTSFPYNAERFISREFTQRLDMLLKERTFDIIQMEGLYLAPYLAQIRELTNAKVVMRAHNIEHEIWERSSHQQSGLKKLYLKNLALRIRRMELGYLNRYDAILPITARDGMILNSLGCKVPTHTVPTGVDTQELQPDHRRMDYPSVFHIGALDWGPNLEGLQWFFKQVWPKVLMQLPELKFYLAGRNAPASLRNAGHDNMVFLGEVDDAYAFMRSKAIMIVPILSGSGMRIKIIEGMALEKTIVTTAIGTEGINTENRKNIFIADNPAEFADTLCELAANKALFSEIGKNARTFVRENYDTLSITRACTEFFQGLT
jgi:glycosyltransferase involved in cell wall biosynthesis